MIKNIARAGRSSVVCPDSATPSTVTQPGVISRMRSPIRNSWAAVHPVPSTKNGCSWVVPITRPPTDCSEHTRLPQEFGHRQPHPLDPILLRRVPRTG